MSASHARSRPPGGAPLAKEVLDIDVLRERAGHDEAFVVELLEDFLCRGVSMPDVFAAEQRRDFAGLGSLAHRLKGSLSSLAATRAASAAGEVELRAATLAIAPDAPDARSIAALTACVFELDARFDEARDAMRAVMDAATSLTDPSSR